MSVKIVYGEVNTGKTKYCFNNIEKIVNQTDKNVIYVVPEQYSLEAERKISYTFSKKALDRVEVLSLERLARRVFSTVGPVMCDFVNDNAKLMIVERAIIKVSGRLSYFLKKSEIPEFASEILNIIKKLKSNCITPDILRAVSDNSNSVQFKYKLYDIYLIYEEYEKFFEFPYMDSDDNMSLLAEKIIKHNLFENTYFIFDNFTSFSKQQFLVIEALMKKSPMTIFTLTTDNLEYKNKYELFYKSKLTATKIFEIAYKNKIDIIPNTYLDKLYDDNKELIFLRKNYFNSNPQKYQDKTNNLFLCVSDNYNNEVEQIAHEIKRLVREKGYRYKDFAVITRSTDLYYPIIHDTFSRYGIFHNITETRHSNSNFLFNDMLSIFNVVINKFSFNSVFTFVRSCICKLDENNKFLLENYILEVGNREQIWNTDSEIKFRGSYNDYEFEKICESIKYIRDCFKSFTDNFKGRKNVTDIIYAYNNFLKYIGADETIKVIVKMFKENGDNDMAGETLSTYNQIINSLNQMSVYFKDVPITFEKFFKILNSALLNTDLETLPSGVDDVIVTTIDRFQSSKAKIVFVLGVSEGAIPTGYVNEGIFKDTELSALGIEENIINKHCDENYVIYRMFSSAYDRLYLSYPMGDNEGKGISPSFIIRIIESIFPSVTVLQNIYEKLNLLNEVEGVIPTFNKIIKNNANGFWNTVSLWYKNNMPSMYSIIENAGKYNNQPAKLIYNNIKSLYGEEIQTSISKIEKYNQCRYAYFLRYGLNVEERKEYKIESKDYGTYMHEIIEKFSLFAEGIGWDKVTEEICEKKACEITEDVLTSHLSEFYTESKRYKYNFKKIISIMKTVLWSITDFYKKSGYASIGHEVSFGEGEDFEPITITLSDGTIVNLRGKIDRADIKRTGNGDFISIVDYKSSSKDIEFEKILCGIQIQLPIYIKAVCDNLSKNNDNVIPAAMLYYHIADPIIKGTKNMSDEQIISEVQKNLQMRGVINESADIPSVYIAKKSATIKQINRICATAYSKMKNALENIIEGNIDINPIYGGDSTACDYCPYGNICNFDTDLENNKYRKYKKIKMEEFFEYVDRMDN